MHDKCIAYTYLYTHDTQGLTCFLYSKTDQRREGRSLQTGFKKPQHVLSLPEINFCANKNRRNRCWSELKCRHVNCLRNAQDFLTQTPRGEIHIIELNPRINGYDAGFEKDEYDCNLDTCKCAHFNQHAIGNILIDWLSLHSSDTFRRYCSFWKNN